MSTVETRDFERDCSLEGLLRQAQAGSSSSFGQLLQTYRDYLLLLADDELGSDVKVKASASDVVQDSCLEAKRDFSQFAGATPAEFQAWLRRLLLNNVSNVIRGFRGTEKRDISREVSYDLGGSNRRDLLAAVNTLSASGVVIQNEQLDSLRNALKKLPEHYQEVIHWRNYERASFEEIGKRMSRSAEAARKLWARAIELLQQELELVNDSTTPGPRS